MAGTTAPDWDSMSRAELEEQCQDRALIDTGKTKQALIDRLKASKKKDVKKLPDNVIWAKIKYQGNPAVVLWDKNADQVWHPTERKFVICGWPRLTGKLFPVAPRTFAANGSVTKPIEEEAVGSGKKRNGSVKEEEGEPMAEEKEKGEKKAKMSNEPNLASLPAAAAKPKGKAAAAKKAIVKQEAEAQTEQEKEKREDEKKKEEKVGISVNKHVLVIGNSNYPGGDNLPNAFQDAYDINAKFKALGYRATLKPDVRTKDEFHEHLDTFANSLDKSDKAVIYYAGHGGEIEGLHFLEMTDGSSVDTQAIAAKLQRKTLSLACVIIDACRAKVTRAGRSGKGVVLPAADASIVVFSCGPWEDASDGEAKNSPFTGQLLKCIEQSPTDDINTIFRRVAAKVYRDTGFKQRPWIHESVVTEDGRATF